jgi:hypothetical protein
MDNDLCARFFINNKWLIGVHVEQLIASYDVSYSTQIYILIKTTVIKKSGSNAAWLWSGPLADIKALFSETKKVHKLIIYS